MKKVLITVLYLLAGSVVAQNLIPLPNMSTSNIPSEEEAVNFVIAAIIKSPDDGLSATESVSVKSYFSLGHDIGSFGKKGDRIWQIHFVEIGETTKIYWLNAESKQLLKIFPKQKE